VVLGQGGLMHVFPFNTWNEGQEQSKVSELISPPIGSEQAVQLFMKIASQVLQEGWHFSLVLRTLL
jgi:hypothetical protein